MTIPTDFDWKNPENDVFEGLDPGFLKENQAWVDSYNHVEWDNINLLDALVTATEKLVLKYSNPNQAIKTSIERVFIQILTKYPLFFGYWKKFTAVEYQLHGLEKSIETLSLALDAFPHSLELWCDYLNVLLANNPDKVDLIRTNFEIARDLIGLQFLSHPFWDKYIQFETEQKQWANVSQIYQAVSRIPLHQYAKYYTGYKAFLQEHPELAGDVKDIDNTFASTQQLVNSVWKYESQIKQTFFNLTPLNEIEFNNWDQYLNFLMDDSRISKELTKSNFERCLVPCQYYEHFWCKYAVWFEQNFEFGTAVNLYKRGVATLPTDLTQFRLQFLKFLKESFKNHKETVVDAYLSTLALYARHWPGASFLMTEYLAMVKRSQYNSDIDQSDKEILSQQTLYANFLESNITKYLEKHGPADSQLIEILNDQNIAVVIVELIKVTWLILKNTMQTRKYFNSFSKLPQLRASTSFWLTYYKFEKTFKNFNKLSKFVSNLGTEFTLPITIMNDILVDYKTFYLTNSDVQEHESISFSENDPKLLDPLLHCDLKINNPLWTPSKNKDFSNWHKTSEFMENGHPGIIVEKPQITNTIMHRNSKSFKNQPPSLPTFRNLEKIHQSVKYKDYLSSDYLGIVQE